MTNEMTTTEDGPGMSLSAAARVLPKSMQDLIQLADYMAESGIAMRKHLRGEKGACLAVAMQAMEWGMNPFTVAQKTFMVNGEMAYEAQLIVAVIKKWAPITTSLKYEFEGEGDKLRCKVSAMGRDGELKEYESPPFNGITPKNSPLWKSDPKQQLGYYSARAWARRHFPEIILGAYDPEEVAAMTAKDVTPPKSAVVEKMQARAEITQQAPAKRGGFNADQIKREIVDAETGEITDIEEVVEKSEDLIDPFTGDIAALEQENAEVVETTFAPVEEVKPVEEKKPEPAKPAAEKKKTEPKPAAAAPVTEAATSDPDKPREKDVVVALNTALWPGTTMETLTSNFEAYQREYGTPPDSIRTLAAKVWNAHKKRVDPKQEVTLAEMKAALEPILGHRWEEGRKT